MIRHRGMRHFLKFRPILILLTEKEISLQTRVLEVGGMLRHHLVQLLGTKRKQKVWQQPFVTLQRTVCSFLQTVFCSMELGTCVGDVT